MPTRLSPNSLKGAPTAARETEAWHSTNKGIATNGLIAELLAQLAEEFVLHLFPHRLHEP